MLASSCTRRRGYGSCAAAPAAADAKANASAHTRARTAGPPARAITSQGVAVSSSCTAATARERVVACPATAVRVRVSEVLTPHAAAVRSTGGVHQEAFAVFLEARRPLAIATLRVLQPARRARSTDPAPPYTAAHRPSPTTSVGGSVQRGVDVRSGGVDVARCGGRGGAAKEGVRVARQDLSDSLRAASGGKERERKRGDERGSTERVIAK